jgi:hypothetical protein
VYDVGNPRIEHHLPAAIDGAAVKDQYLSGSSGCVNKITQPCADTCEAPHFTGAFPMEFPAGFIGDFTDIRYSAAGKNKSGRTCSCFFVCVHDISF